MLAIILLGALILFALVMILTGIYGLRHYYGQEWIKSNGIVVSSNPLWASGSRFGTTIYRPYVKYEYEFNGKKVISERLFPTKNEKLGERNRIEEFLVGYPCGKVIEIHVNKKLGDAVVFLENTKVSKSSFSALIVGGAILVLLCFLILFLTASNL